MGPLFDIAIIDAQLIAFGSLLAINKLAVFRESLTAGVGSSKKTSSSWARACQIKDLIKNGMEFLPTKNELMLTPIINIRYPELFA